MTSVHHQIVTVSHGESGRESSPSGVLQAGATAPWATSHLYKCLTIPECSPSVRPHSKHFTHINSCSLNTVLYRTGINITPI